MYLDFADQVGIILAGEPGAGKSVGLANIVAHGALSYADCRLTLIDGALVELGIWRDCADEFVGPDINHAIAVIERQQQADHRLLRDAARHRPPEDRQGRRRADQPDRHRRAGLLLRHGRHQSRAGEVQHHACGTAPPGAASAPTATSSPLSGPPPDIVPTSLRDLFGYRWAFRCATDDSSDVVLGKGTAKSGYTAATIADSPGRRPAAR